MSSKNCLKIRLMLVQLRLKLNWYEPHVRNSRHLVNKVRVKYFSCKFVSAPCFTVLQFGTRTNNKKTNNRRKTTTTTTVTTPKLPINFKTVFPSCLYTINAAQYLEITVMASFAADAMVINGRRRKKRRKGARSTEEETRWCMTNVRVCIKKLDQNYHILVHMDAVLRRRKKKTTVKQKQTTTTNEANKNLETKPHTLYRQLLF